MKDENSAHLGPKQVRSHQSTNPSYPSYSPRRTSHLTTLVGRFLKTLQNMKSWNQLERLKGEDELKHHLCNIIEYTFYFHKKQITEQEVEKLIHLLEKEEITHEQA